ncbi:hypothetical protein, partial [Mesorhizobium sp.]|uniref:hypothetical protein n=1 Tax=Mesorhizobium sp. TaxID=1871066 RepID=UPI0025E4C114
GQRRLEHRRAGAGAARRSDPGCRRQLIFLSLRAGPHGRQRFTKARICARQNQGDYLMTKFLTLPALTLAL